MTTTAVAAQRMFADVTGKWEISLSMNGAASTSMLDVTQKGDSISGTIESEQIGSRAIAGTVKGDTVRFGFSVDMQGNVLEITAGALVKDKDSMEGEIALPNGMGAFPFSAKRKP
ncbi:MAG TPA: hypothetical protein VE869_02310 [Gemmatimonas sp.]|nr:hypothetical protein [Gemmatimonas sp.]